MTTFKKHKQRQTIVTIWLAIIILILAIDQLSVNQGIQVEQSEGYLIITSDINSDDIREESNSIYRIQMDGTEVKRIIRSVDLTSPYHTRISSVDCHAPSQQLAIATDSFYINGFYMADIDGTNPRNQKPRNGVINGIRDVSFAQGGHSVLVSKQIQDDPIDPDLRSILMVADLNQERYTSLKSEVSRSYSYPGWSNQSQKIVYVYKIDGNIADYPFVIATADMTGADEQIIYQTSHYIEGVDWSPDGEWIVANIGSQIYKMRADGRDYQQLTYTPNGATSAIWSPDGTQISFVSQSSFPNTYHLMSMDNDGSNMQKIGTFKRNIMIHCWMD